MQKKLNLIYLIEIDILVQLLFVVLRKILRFQAAWNL